MTCANVHVDASNATHLTVATLLFLGLFSFLLLPPPLNVVSDAVQGFATTLYRITRTTGVVTDAHMCMLADLWNLGGLEAQLEGGGTVSCALLSERKIAITPADERAYGEGLGGVLESVDINNWLTLNKLFYVSYVLMGLALAAVITDVYMSFRGKPNVSMALGYLFVGAIGVTLLLFRTGAVWPALSLIANTIPGNSLMADAIATFLSLSLMWWVVGQIALGYNVTKKSYQKVAAIKQAGELDYRRGMLALNEAKKRRKQG